MVATFKHLVAALSVLYTVSSTVATTYPSIGRIWAGTVGRHRATSLIAVLSAPIAASAVGLLIWSTYGYCHVKHAVIGDTHDPGQWVTDLWSTTELIAVALPGLSALVALATTFSTKNSGLAPLITLVMDPIFGAGLSRYGLPIAHFPPNNLHRLSDTMAMHFETVGAVETLGTALFLTLLWGIPIGTLGFTPGTLARRIGRLFRLNDGQSGVPGA